MRCRHCQAEVYYVPLAESGNETAIWYAPVVGRGGFYCATSHRQFAGSQWHQPFVPPLTDRDHLAAWLEGKPYRPKRTGFAIAA